MYPPIFETLVECFRKFPGVGQKTAERYAFEFLKWDQEEIDDFLKACSLAKNKLHKCKICGNLAEDDLCEICKDTTRDITTICVVEQVQDLMAMEKTNEYKGVYHVLNGAISPSKGILPDDINIDALIKRCDDSISEVIIATNPTVEGDATASYIAALAKRYNISVSKLASGVPLGGDLDNIDEQTIAASLAHRRPY